jgi:hypothetical protein
METLLKIKSSNKNKYKQEKEGYTNEETKQIKRGLFFFD